MEKEMKYEAAVGELEEIVAQMENDELDIDELTAKLKRAQQLLAMCKKRLTNIDKEVSELLQKDDANS